MAVTSVANLVACDWWSRGQHCGFGDCGRDLQLIPPRVFGGKQVRDEDNVNEPQVFATTTIKGNKQNESKDSSSQKVNEERPANIPSKSDDAIQTGQHKNLSDVEKDKVDAKKSAKVAGQRPANIPSKSQNATQTEQTKNLSDSVKNKVDANKNPKVLAVGKSGLQIVAKITDYDKDEFKRGPDGVEFDVTMKAKSYEVHLEANKKYTVTMDAGGSKGGVTPPLPDGRGSEWFKSKTTPTGKTILAKSLAVCQNTHLSIRSSMIRVPDAQPH